MVPCSNNSGCELTTSMVWSMTHLHFSLSFRSGDGMRWEKAIVILVNAEKGEEKISKVEECFLFRKGSRIGKLAFLHRKNGVFFAEENRLIE